MRAPRESFEAAPVLEPSGAEEPGDSSIVVEQDTTVRAPRESFGAAPVLEPSGAEEPGDSAIVRQAARQEQDGMDAMFQISHCHVAIPGAGERVLTNNGERVWLANLSVMHTTGRLT